MDLRGRRRERAAASRVRGGAGPWAWQGGAARPWRKLAPGWVGLGGLAGTRRRGIRPGLGRGVGPWGRRAGWGLAVRVGQGQESSTCSRLPQKARGRGAESGHGDLVPAGVGYPGQGELGSDQRPLALLDP